VENLDVVEAYMHPRTR